MRNIITRAVGSALYVDADLYELDLTESDLLLFCSDGLYGSLNDQILSAILRQCYDLSDTCEALVDAAYAAGSRDNITVLLSTLETGVRP